MLETLKENPAANRQWLLHARTKGARAAWVLTKALYTTTKKNARIEMAYFFNNLSEKVNGMLQSWMNSFKLGILSNSALRKKVGDVLN